LLLARNIVPVSRSGTGLDATFLIGIYCGLIVYVGVVAPRRHLFLVAAMSAFAFTLLVLLEQWHVLSTYPVFGGFPGGHPTWNRTCEIWRQTSDRPTTWSEGP
jgi:hypothetical protein